jgi:hypothetical protein
MSERELLLEEIKKIDRQLEIVTRQIDNSDYNITGLIAQKTRHMDRRDFLEAEKLKLEEKLKLLPDGETGV